MLVHSVFFWLPHDLPAEKRATFKAALDKLVTIPSVKHGFIGVPAATARPAIDRTYSYALTLIFEGMTEHDAYQVHPDHKSFVDTFNSYWIKVVIYDAQ